MTTESAEDADYAAFLSRSQAQYESGQNLASSLASTRVGAQNNGRKIGSKTLSSESDEDFVSFEIDTHGQTNFASALGVADDSCQDASVSAYAEFTEVLEYVRSLGGNQEPTVYEVTQGTRTHVYIVVRKKGKWVGAKSVKIES